MTARPAAKIVLLAGSLLSVLGCPGSTPPAQVEAPSPDPSMARNGLDGDDQARFYHLSEGSEVYPLSWLRALTDSVTKRPFMEELQRFGLIPDGKGPHNPEGLPIGITADQTRDLRFAGTTMVGVNCAACHVSELSRDGRTVVRIDGAPNLFDLSRFYGDLAKSTAATFTDVGELWAFLGRLRQQPGGREEAGEAGPTAALSRAYPRFEAMRQASGADKTFAQELQALHQQELARPAELLGKGVVLAGRGEAGAAPPGTVRGEAFEPRARKVLAAPPNETAAIERLAPADGRQEAVQRSFADFVNTMRLLKARAEFLVHLATRKDRDPTLPGFGRVDAFGGARNLLFPADAQPLTAPIGYPHLWDIGRTSWYHWDGSTNSLLERNVGQALGLGAVFDRSTFVSTVNIANIQELERIAAKIKPPAWPRAFGTPDAASVTRGRELFRVRCATCHDDPPAGQPLGDRLFALDKIGTDRRRALNFALPVGTTEFDAAISTVLKKIISAAGGTPRPEDVWRVTRQYAGRPLVAVWATAPYLHNGSVPTIQDLLLPAKTRPPSFPVCNREYDPVNLGLADGGSDSSCVFDTTRPGNGNGGHTGREYGTEGLSREERNALIDYLKGP